MTDRNLDDLDPAFKPVAVAILAAANAAISQNRCNVTITWRDAQEQDEAAADGASKAHFGQSPHNCVDSDGNPAARAFDFAIITPHGQYVTDGSDSRYATVGRIAVEQGCVWGGNWNLETDGCEPDFDHIEMANWKSAS